jgi:hypothetical protein
MLHAQAVLTVSYIDDEEEENGDRPQNPRLTYDCSSSVDIIL